MKKSAILVLEDGNVFHGQSIGAIGSTIGELVFNTSMTGYQEILSDPSYKKQIVTLTNPHIGNTGTNSDDNESHYAHASGLVIRDLAMISSSFRSQSSLESYLVKNKVVAIAGIDTRRLTRILRSQGTLAGCILSGENITTDTAKDNLKNFRGLSGLDLAKEVSTETIYEWDEGSWQLNGESKKIDKKRSTFNVVAYDFGIKQNLLRMLVDRDCHVTVVPAQTTASEVLALNPDGIFLSNGPGDPEPCKYAIDAVRELIKTEKPIFGVCLGHQIIIEASATLYFFKKSILGAKPIPLPGGAAIFPGAEMLISGHEKSWAKKRSLGNISDG